jgi:hypothetical protein
VGGEPFAQPRLAETGDAHHALLGRRALGEPRQRRPDLAAHAEDDDVACKPRELGGQCRRRRGHHVLEVIDVAEAIGQRGRWRHPGGFPE